MRQRVSSLGASRGLGLPGHRRSRCGQRRLDVVDRHKFLAVDLHHPDLTLRRALRNHRVRVGGLFSLGTCFGSNGTLLVSDQNFARLLGHPSIDAVNVGLVRLQQGVAPEQAAQELGVARERVFDVAHMAVP